MQHGASTLPEEAFGRFAEANAIEVHLATAFQNRLYDSAAFPAELRDEIYAHLAANHADERKAGMTDAQFYYTTRKRGFGPFKRQLWDLPAETRGAHHGRAGAGLPPDHAAPGRGRQRRPGRPHRQAGRGIRSCPEILRDVLAGKTPAVAVAGTREVYEQIEGE